MVIEFVTGMIMGSSSNDQYQNNQIVKGKRTKRQRSTSPFGFAVTDSSSSGNNSGADESYYSNNNNNNSVMSFPTTSGESTEEEDQDMANCLIMLAQGDDRSRQINQENIIDDKVQKFNASRKFTTAVTSNNKAGAGGFYVYECKTCNRSFPSFQALGGHRASHKKPKAALAEAPEKKSSASVPALAVLPTKNEYKDSYSSLHHHDQSHMQAASAAATAANNNNTANNNNKGGNKIHECSICGSEFTSGQALGGHMRRHRAAVATGNNINQVATIESNIGDVKPVAATRSILPLDLNLPAPEDDHHIRFGATQQSLVFSAPALVDCHY